MLLPALAPLIFAFSMAPSTGDGTWVQTGFGEVTADVTHNVGYGIQTYNSAVTIPAQSGTDDSSNPHAYPDVLSGTVSEDPPWNVDLESFLTGGPYPATYVNMPWSCRSQSVPAHTTVTIETYWKHTVAFQTFDYRVDGTTTMSARRDYEEWSPDDYAVVITTNDGGGGDPG